MNWCLDLQGQMSRNGLACRAFVFVCKHDFLVYFYCGSVRYMYNAFERHIKLAQKDKLNLT